MSDKLTRRGVFTRLGGIIAGTAVTPMVGDGCVLPKGHIVAIGNGDPEVVIRLDDIDGKRLAEAIIPHIPDIVRLYSK